MNIIGKSNLQLEILIATMNRTSLDFLKAMFKNVDISECQILIVNQTTPEFILSSEVSNIRVFNSFDKGLSQSRNLALRNAVGDICLLADDDVVYADDFQNHIYQAFSKYPLSDIITFQMINNEGDLYVNYPKILRHDKKTVETANSVVICFKTKSVKEKQVFFNLNFGLGATFPTADEYVFLRNALKKGLNIYFEPKILLSHPNFSSGRDSGSDKIVYARAALFYKYSGMLGYLRLGKHLWMIYNLGFISFDELVPKYLRGLNGIRRYRELEKQGFEKK